MNWRDQSLNFLGTLLRRVQPTKHWLPSKAVFNEGVAVFAVMTLSGYFGPWWILVAPAFVYGVLRSECPGKLATAFIAAAAAWIIPAFIQDATVGFRISLRIAGLAHSPTRLAAYAITGLIASLIAGLSWTIGSSLRGAVQRYGPGRSSAEEEPAG